MFKCRTSIIYFKLQDGCLVFYLALEQFLGKESEMIQCLTGLSILTELLPMSVILLLSVLIWFVSLLFEHLNGVLLKILQMAVINESRLERWRCQHALICELIARINRCFGLILLLAITNTFISFVTLTFELAMVFQEDAGHGYPILIIKLLRQLVRLVMITFSVHRMQSEVFTFPDKNCFN